MDSNPFKCPMPVAWGGHQLTKLVASIRFAPQGQIGHRVPSLAPHNTVVYDTMGYRIFYLFFNKKHCNTKKPDKVGRKCPTCLDFSFIRRISFLKTRLSPLMEELKKRRNIKKLPRRNKGSTAQLRLRTSADLLLPAFGSENGKDSAAVASVSWLTDAAYPLRVHTVFPHFPNLIRNQNLSLSAFAE